MSDGLFSDADLDLENMIKERASKPAEKKKEDKEEKATEGPFDKRLYIIDGYSVIYRNYFAHLSNPLTDKNGNNISAYFGFFSTLFSLMSAYKMDYLAVVMDERTPTFRKEMYPEYKANRDKAPEDLHAQVPMIKSTLEKIGIACLSNPGFEADDIIATLVEMATRQGMETVMVTGDNPLTAKYIAEKAGVETRTVIPGHLQRGGSPSPYDRLLSTEMGSYAGRLAKEGKHGVTVALRGTEITYNALADIAGKMKFVPTDHQLLGVARSIGISFGDGR